MSELAIEVCGVCNGSGWDEVFGCACGECGADLATADAVEDAKVKYAEAQATVEAHMAERVALIDWLRTQDWEFPQSLVAQFEKKGDLSTKQWAAVERLKAKEADITPRWTKVGEQWGVRAPGHEVGESIEVTNKAKVTSTVYLASRIEGDIFAIGDAPGTFRPEAPGLYAKEDGTIVKVQQSRTSGRLYGKTLDEDGHFEYDPKAIREVTRLLSLEEAAEYGRRTGVCCVCGRELTNEASIEAGIGPVCAGRF